MLIMNEMYAFPVVVGLLLSTAVLSAVVTQAMPYVPEYWNALKNVIRRKLTRKPKMDMVDLVIIAQLQDRIDNLEEQMNNLAKNHYRRETNRKNNIRRDVREYLEELRK